MLDSSSDSSLKAAALASALLPLGALCFLKGQDLRDWLSVQLSVSRIHLGIASKRRGSLREWLETQYQAWQMLYLEKSRRLEALRLLRSGDNLHGQLSPELPHVDSLAKTQQKKSQRKKSQRKMSQREKSQRGSSNERSAMSGAMDDTPVLKDVVLIGGGHAHAYVLKRFGMEPLQGVRVTLISRDILTPYSGMIPGYVAGFYSKEECHIDLTKLGNFAQAVFIRAEACGIDSVNKQVVLKGGRPPVPYDVLSIDIGSTPTPGGFVRQGLTPVKPIDSFCARWDSIMQRVLDSPNKVDLVVVGGGAGGCELCLSMEARLRRELEKRGKDFAQAVSFRLLTRGETIFPSHSAETQRRFRRIFTQRKISVEVGCEVVGCTEKTVRCSNGKEFKADEILWCTQAGAAPWLKEVARLELDEEGFIRVDETMQTSLPNVFACGDIAALPDPRPKAGVFAVRAGPCVSENIRNCLAGERRERWSKYQPQASFMGIIGTGDKRLAVASRGHFAVEGEWVWDLKDWIDRKWMAGYTYALPEVDMAMNAELERRFAGDQEVMAVLAHASMRCGGCGAKVGSSVLSRVMKRLQTPVREGGFGGIPTNDSVLVGVDAPDDAAVVKTPGSDHVLVHTVDFFRQVVNDPYLFGKIATNHALSDCFAMGATPVSALAIAVVPYSTESKVEATLYQMMAGACSALKEVGCALVGGHTCEGKELALGFAVNGVSSQSALLAKGGMNVGDKLILTKGLGTGTILAAEMRRKANGVWWQSAVEAMVQSNYAAAKVLQECGATACTDITGFGFLGHLVEMLKTSHGGVNALIQINKLPLLEGALECVKQGVFSSLQPANLKFRRTIRNEAEALQHPVYPLLFDPQTSGGLLASVPSAAAESCIESLRKQGYTTATIIGQVVEKPSLNGASDAAAGEIDLVTVSLE